jgi:predicted transcriptional regulator
MMSARKVTTTPDRLTITLDAEDRAKLARVADRTDRSLAWLVRDAIKQYLAANSRKNL